MTNDQDKNFGASSGDMLEGQIARWGVETPFPDVIEIANDSPVMIGEILGADGGDSSLRIVKIDGRDIDPVNPTQLPGIRIGGEAGGGFIFRRELDKQLVFAPDADYSGITSFNYTIADNSGAAATVRATVSVLPAIFGALDLTFADGTQWASVPEGIDAAILGALTIGGADWDHGGVVQVFENGSNKPSTRFAVIGDKLNVVGPLDAADGYSVELRVVVHDADGNEVITSSFDVDVRRHGGPDTIEDDQASTSREASSSLQGEASGASATGWAGFFEHAVVDYFNFYGTETSLDFDPSEDEDGSLSEHTPEQAQSTASVVFEEAVQADPGSAQSDIISL